MARPTMDGKGDPSDSSDSDSESDGGKRGRKRGKNREMLDHEENDKMLAKNLRSGKFKIGPELTLAMVLNG